MIDLPEAQVQCIGQAIYHEARGESVVGQRAVGHVIMNRSRARNLPPCIIITQPRQFSFRVQARYSGSLWNHCLRIARNLGSDPTFGAQYFHNNQVNPGWRRRVTVRIGNHVFYR